jgi:hypothetical protein
MVLRLAKGDATLSELRLREMNACAPGLPKPNPGLELANAFSVIRHTLSFHTLSVLTPSQALINLRLTSKSVAILMLNLKRPSLWPDSFRKIG